MEDKRDWLDKALLLSTLEPPSLFQAREQEEEEHVNPLASLAPDANVSIGLLVEPAPGSCKFGHYKSRKKGCGLP